MDALLDLARVIASRTHGRKAVDTVLRDSGSGTIATFIHGLLNNTYESDHAAAQALYGCDPNDPRYRTLKSRAQDRLHQILLILDVKAPGYSRYQATYHRCARNLIAARLLLSFASPRAGTRIAEKTLQTARQYQFTDIVLGLLRLLRNAAGIANDRRRFLLYSNELSECLGHFAIELRSDALLDSLQLETRLAAQLDAQARLRVQAWFEEHQNLVDSANRYKLHLNASRFAIVWHGLQHNMQGLVEACDTALLFLADKPHLADPSRISAFGLLKARACLLNNQADMVLSSIDEVIDGFTPGTGNWFLALEYAIRALLQSNQYDRAAQQWLRARNHRAYDRFAGNERNWQLIEAYMHVMHRLQLVMIPDKTGKRFKRLAFLGDIPEFARTTLEMNMHVLIVHASMLILEGDFVTADARIEYMRLYAERYLKEPQHETLRTLVKLLRALSRTSYQVKRLPASHAQLVVKLANRPTQNLISDFVELLPLHTLYTGLVRHLQQR